MQSLIGVKKEQTQRFLENGMRIPVTLIDVKGISVVSVKTADKDKYQAIQLGFGKTKKASKAELGHAKGAKRDGAPKFLREVRILTDEALPEVGTDVNPTEVLKAGDIVNISGVSKGKGFAGVVKRHGFHGGPKTHGQSDRHRAPGAIGQGTTPGRVYRGKRMAGRMGSDNVTIANLKVVDVDSETVMIKGLVPGIINSLLVIKKTGEDKKFVPLWKPADESEAAGRSSVSDDAQTVEEKTSSSDSSSLSGNQPTDVEEQTESGEGSVSDSSENGQAPAVQDESSTEVKKEGNKDAK